MKYDWKQLEKEYVLGEYKSVNSFLKDKKIPNNGNTKKSTKGWKNKKVLKEEQKSTKTIEKVIEKQSEKEAQQIVDLKGIANELALKIIQANTELDRHIARNKTKTKTVTYDNNIAKPTKETIEEMETVTDYVSIVDRQGLKQLTSALKDLNDVLTDKDDSSKENKIDQYLSKLEGELHD